MGFVTNDPKKGDEQQPGGAGLVVDLGLMACPQCRREVPEWSRACPDCGVPAVARTALGSAMPDIPAHLLGDPDDPADEAGAAAAPADETDAADAPSEQTDGARAEAADEDARD